MDPDWSKIIPALLALGLGAGGGSLSMNSFNVEERRILLEEEQAKRDHIQLLLDRQTAAHERAMKAAQDAYSLSLKMILDGVPL